MVSDTQWKSTEHFLNTVRAVSELTVDLIKVAPDGILRALPADALRDSVKPILYAGGPRSDNFAEDVKLAATVGFSGVCIGRNLFQSSDPRSAMDAVDRAFGNVA
jgi:DhnA family fructose-bisphosphate aldolase class Ia